MKRALSLLGSLLLALAAGHPASAQEAVRETPVDDIIVEGQSLEAAAEAFVSNLTAPPRRRGLARWTDTLCIGVANLQNDIAHVVIDRVSEVAEGLGVPLGAPGCEPNLLIVFTDDARGAARQMVDRHRSRFFRFGYSRSNRGSRALTEFVEGEAPVRWWHVSIPVFAGTRTPAIRLPGEGPVLGFPCRSRGAPGENGSFRQCNAVSDMIVALIVVVDVDQVGDFNISQLSDYLALVALAQVEPDADHTAFDTVLNLFEPSFQVAGLTEWDFLYLEALYSGEDERRDPAEVAAQMVPGLRERQTAE